MRIQKNDEISQNKYVGRSLPYGKPLCENSELFQMNENNYKYFPKSVIEKKDALLTPCFQAKMNVE